MRKIRGELAIIACRNGEDTAKLLQQHLGCKKINADVKDFKDGEIKITIKDSINGKDLFIVQNTLNPRRPQDTSNHMMELFLMVDAARRSGAGKISVILPYMSYSKQEKRSGRQPISAKMVIDFLEKSGVSRLITVDLHAPAIEGFSDKMKINNIYASIIFKKYLADNNFNGVLIAPDPGAGKMVKHYAQVLNLPMAFGYKYRNPDTMHEVSEQKLLGEVNGKSVAIIDDQTAGSGTMINMAKLAKEKGAKDVLCVACHGMLLGDAEEQYKKAVEDETIKKLVITNTLIQPKSFLENNPYIETVDAIRIIAEFVSEIHNCGSTTRLYGPELGKSHFG